MSDPTWLPDVLRAEGLQCNIFPGAFDRGHGDFGNIWGVVCHHTGSFSETPNGIANHPTLGLASQLYLSPDGIYTLCGVGVAWHAGEGSWPGIATNNANQVTIGIEPANDGGGTPGKPHRTGWPDAQYNAYVRGVGAILRHLGVRSDRCIGHKEWAGAAQGKWDPGSIDMNIFRSDVQAVIDGQGGSQLNAIDEQYQRSPWLGKRLTGELPTPDNRGRFSQFENGYIYWTAETSAWPIPTHVFEAWAALGYEAGPLGYPVAYHTVLKDGDVQAFERGILYRKYGKDGFYVTGAIGDKFRREGYEAGRLGWPTSNEARLGALAYQDFEKGRVAWSPDSTVLLKPGLDPFL